MKTIDPDAIALMLFPIEILGGLEEALRELFQKLPVKQGGIAVEEEDFVAAGVKLYYDSAKPLIETMLHGQLPDVSEIEIPEPDDGWTRIMWGGNPNEVPQPNSAEDQYMGFNRVWHSCTDEPCRTIVRQFELPSNFPTSGSAVFRFSDGYEGRVPDLSASTKYLDRIAGNGRGVKYVRGQPTSQYIHDRKSDIAAPEGSKVEWMEYKVE